MYVKKSEPLCFYEIFKPFSMTKTFTEELSILFYIVREKSNELFNRCKNIA